MDPIPDYLLQEIRAGNVCLLFGSGASMSAKDIAGDNPPSATKLTKLLSQKFLGGKFNDHLLDQVAEIAISESDLITVQRFIHDIFEPFQPSKPHKILPTFSWHGLATTNFDLLIETAYESVRNPIQSVQPRIANGDRIQERLKNPRNISLLKLHGCITRIIDERCPLILTPDQYISHRDNRDRLFNELFDWAFEHPIVFIGHSLRDADIRALLQEVIAKAGQGRPRYYAVLPHVTPEEKRLWYAKRITIIESSFEEFMAALDNAVPSPLRGIIAENNNNQSPLFSRFDRAETTLSDRARRFLEIDVDYVLGINKIESVSGEDFYSGAAKGWAPIEMDLDCRRSITDQIMSDVILSDEEHVGRVPDAYLITAHAGAGKSVLLHRLAWDAANDYGKLCLFMTPHGSLDWPALQEIIDKCKERIYLFIDNAADRIQQLAELFSKNDPDAGMLTLILSERTNEWNMLGEDTGISISETYEIKYLSEKEIYQLLALLEKHKALGVLTDETPQRRVEAFKERAGRQLLVALHEATYGEDFEKIIVDEYNALQPLNARNIYLSICVLNRLGVGVRAGIISRLYGINFVDFKKHFFLPLERVVLSRFDPTIRDHLYTARHPHIADIVFINVLTNQEERFDVYIRCLKQLNLDYDIDRRAFDQMIRARVLLDLFTNTELIPTVFEQAKEAVGDEPFLMQQMAIYEMQRDQGNLQKAKTLLMKAKDLAPRSNTIRHSISELCLKEADQSKTALQRDKYLEEAESHAQEMLRRGGNNAYSHHTLCKAKLRRLRHVLENNENSTSTEIETLIRDLENAICDGLRENPSDPRVLNTEAQLASILNDSTRAVNAIERAFKANPRNVVFAIRLSSIYCSKGESLRAKEVLEEAINAKPTDHMINYAYAKHLINTDLSDQDRILYYLKRSYSPGDHNLDAQFAHAVILYNSGNFDDSRLLFQQLTRFRLSPRARKEIRFKDKNRFKGRIVKIETTYAFIRTEIIGQDVFLHKVNTNSKDWKNLSTGIRLEFSRGFALRGPVAFDIKILG